MKRKIIFLAVGCSISSALFSTIRKDPPTLYSKVNGFCEVSCALIGTAECEEFAYFTFEDCVLERNPVPGYLPY